MKSSLVISTYNWPKALQLVLKSLNAQTRMPNELIIADDGSTGATKKLIAEFKNTTKIPVRHIWHEDNGFRKAEILNKAIAQSSGDYIIQVDGDCIMHPRFIEDHLGFAQKNTYLYGSRVNIQHNHLEQLFSDHQTRFSMFSKGIKKRTRAVHLPLLSYLYLAKHKHSKKYRGCNTSFFKSDFIAVNGYNEDFKGWGREDSELAMRFYNAGLRSRRLRYRGIVYHIYHYEKPKDRLALNNDIEQNTIKMKLVWAENGINKYIKE
ncbi:glycosyltransferase family 2 protein [Winogradskyella sp. DF17]|uniref:Glycosyltransferase family 2 protein n=1 Tax=Winogradskyella pelagia TaxID=2819984 RepID=A0ABS3T0C8_9FLAO|nr:glycosyltransferase family 2 protein [Winogradskyella sp. DF17]MBO3116193.1 glycosyltransferase family 2 protein [Winogradskyella sp. DF17]